MTRTKYYILYEHDGNDIVYKKTLNNLNVLKNTIEYCISKNWNYRIGSGIIPLFTLLRNSHTEKIQDKPEIQREFKTVAGIIKRGNVRCSMHPDQFVVLGSCNPFTRSDSIEELKYHAYIMDELGLPQSYDSPINIHMNCYKEGIVEISKRFIAEYNKLPDNVKSRLVLECEDKKNSWGICELYDYFYKPLGIPITYDSHHFRLNNPTNMSPEEAIEMCIETWGKHRPLFHFSNGKSNSKDRSHSEYVYELHDELLKYDVDVEFEFKGKDYAIEKAEKSFKI